MPKPPPDVDAHLAAMAHARKDEVLRLRAAILASDPGITETVKWNAPSFVYAGEDRVTFRLQPRDRVQLVLHRGAKVRDDAKGFAVEDPDGLLEWLAPDRAVITLADAEETAAREAQVVAMVGRWVRA